MGIFYIVGVIIATVLAVMLLIVAERENKKKAVKDELQPGMVAVLGLMSWFSVVMILWKYRPQLEKFFKKG
jgi:NADH:ubiquinone oxidoreductase subunit 6 (subunit J)